MAAKDDYLLENLLDLGYVNHGQVTALRTEAEAAGSGVVDLMLDKKVITSAILTQAKAAHFGFEVVTLSEIRLDDELISSVPRNVAKRYRVVPVYRHGNHLAVALSDPSDLNTIDSLQHILRAELDVKVASEDEIDAALKKYYGADDSDLGKMIQDITEGEVEVGAIGGSENGETVDADAPIINTNTLLRAMQYAATYGYTVWLRAEDFHLSNSGIAHDGEVATRLGLGGIPVSAETVAIATITILMRETGANVHLARLSSRLGVDAVRAAKADGLPITCDVGIHHLLLTDRDIGYFDSQYRFAPPLRSPTDRDALSRAVIDGTIDAICSDHTPHDDDAKNVPFGEALPGSTGLELLLPLTLKWAAAANVTIPLALKKISADPARLLALPAGALKVGQAADICIFDPRAFWAVTAQTLRSQGKNSPYLRRELEGRVSHTLIEGRLVFQA